MISCTDGDVSANGEASAGVAVPGEVGEPALRRRMRIHRRVVGRPFEVRIEVRLTAGAPVQRPRVLTDLAALDRRAAAGAPLPVAPVDGEPAAALRVP